MKRIGKAATVAVTAMAAVALGVLPAQAYDITGKSADDLQVRNLRVVSVTGIVMQVDNTNVYAQASDLNKIHDITATAAAVNQAAAIAGGSTYSLTNASALNVSGASALHGTTVAGNLGITTGLVVAGASTFTGTVTTVGNVAAASLTTTGTVHGALAATLDNTLSTAGIATFSNYVNFIKMTNGAGNVTLAITNAPGNLTPLQPSYIMVQAFGTNGFIPFWPQQ